jgi:hypothetical protein
MSVQQIRTLPGECYVIAALRYDRPEVLRYALPGWQLRSRPVCPGEEEGHMFYGKVSADEGGPLWVDYSRDLRGDDWTDPFLCRKDVSIRLGTWSSWSKDHQLLTGSGYFVVASPGHDGEVLAGSFATQRVSLEVQLDGSFATTLRLQPPWLFFGDSAGRIFQYDLQTGRELAVITPH